jgi:hypothetical protein
MSYFGHVGASPDQPGRILSPVRFGEWGAVANGVAQHKGYN